MDADRAAPTPQDGQDEAVARAARTLLEFTELPEDVLLRVVIAGIKQLSPEHLRQVEEQARALRLTKEQEEVARARETLADLTRKTGRGAADLFPDLVPGRAKVAHAGSRAPLQ